MMMVYEMYVMVVRILQQIHVKEDEEIVMGMIFVIYMIIVNQLPTQIKKTVMVMVYEMSAIQLQLFVNECHVMKNDL